MPGHSLSARYTLFYVFALKYGGCRCVAAGIEVAEEELLRSKAACEELSRSVCEVENSKIFGIEGVGVKQFIT
jgi:hypothetical protein